MRRATSWRRLRDELGTYAGAVNHIHASAAITRCAHLLDGGSGSSSGDGSSNGGQSSSGDGDADSSSAGGSAPPASGELCAFLLQLLRVVSQFVPRYRARQTSNSLWALAKLQPYIAAAAAAAAAQGSATDAAAPDQRTRQQAEQQSGGPDLLAEADALVAQLTARAAAAWPECTAEELAVGLHALAALRAPAAAAGLGAATEHAAAVAHSLKPQEIPMLIAATHALGAALPPAAWARLLPRALDTAPELGPRQLAGLLHGLACVAARDPQLHPGHDWLSQLVGAAGAAVPQRFNCQDTAVCLYSLGLLRHRPADAWLAAALRQAVAQRRRMSGGGLCMVLRGVSGMRVRPPEVWTAAMVAEAVSRWDLLREGRPALREPKPPLQQQEQQQQQQPEQQQQQQQHQPEQQQRERLMLLCALARMRYQPPPEQLRSLVERAAEDAEANSRLPDAVSTMLWALARLAYLPPRALLSALLSHAFAALPCASPQGVACTLYATALLLAPVGGLAAGAGLRGAWERALVAAWPRLGQLTPQGLAMAAWACVQLQSPSTAAQQRSRPGGGGLDSRGGTKGGASSRDSSGGGGSGAAQTREWVQAAVDAAWAQGLDTATSQAAAVLLWSAAHAGCDVPPAWIAAALQRQAELAGRARPQAVALTLWSLGALTRQRRRLRQQQQQQQQQQRLHPAEEWWATEPIASLLSDLLAASEPRLHAWRPQELASTAWALSRLGVAPPDGWLRRFLSVSSRKLPAFSDQQLANLAWGLLRSNIGRPPLPWISRLRDEAAARRSEGGGERWRALDRRTVAQAVAVWLKGGAFGIPPRGSDGV
jgi:hypothetical protein